VLADVILQVDRRDAIRTYRGRGEIDDEHPLGDELLRCLGVRVSRGRVESDLDLVLLDMWQKTVDALVGRLEAEIARPAETVGSRVDPHQPHRFDGVAALGLDDEIGANVSRSDDDGFNLHGDPFKRT
jgi:hypothetical protein